MKNDIKKLLEQAAKKIVELAELSWDTIDINVEQTRDKAHGDYASNLAMMLAKQVGMAPRDLAGKIIEAFPANQVIEKIEIAGPGFINFYLKSDAAQQIVKRVLQEKNQYGLTRIGQGKKIHIEFVSANPTGPLHVGHGRGAAYGAALADLLAAVGYDVHREYYVNDAGRQMHILATSVWLRYLQLLGQEFVFPSNGYKGQYIFTIAEQLKAGQGEKLFRPTSQVFENVPTDAQEDGTGDKEAHIDALIVNAQHLLATDYQKVFQLALNNILDDIREDLREFGVIYQEWYSEQSLVDKGLVDQAIDELTKRGYTYELEGALWFRSTQFADDKDRVLKRADGRTTYFASDVAYHLSKIKRGYEIIIDVLGADHHGYIPRVRAAMRALGIDDQHFAAPLVQFAVLYRHNEKVQMSTRSGEFVTLRELREEIGKDACRFFYVMRKSEQHMDFDLDLATSKTNENPVYYIQYAHARVCSVMRQLTEKGFSYQEEVGLHNLSLLTSEYENNLMAKLMHYPEVIQAAARNFEPHLVTTYLRDLAQEFHVYYNAEQFIVENELLRQARLCLIQSVKQVLVNGLSLLSVSAPERM